VLIDSLWTYDTAILPYLSRLIALLEDPDSAVRQGVIFTLATISRPDGFDLSRSVAPIIAAMRDDPVPRVSEAASQAAHVDPQPGPQP